jgi:SAM-dependent methyltransferase
VKYSTSFTNDDWISVDITNIGEGKIALFLEKFEVVNMSNTNMSNEERSSLIGRISVLLQQNNHDDVQHLHHQMKSLGDDKVLIYHCSSSSSSQQSDISHFIHIGKRMAIGPAGTRGAPSQTLRRTHRGILKEYALKRRVGTTTNGATSNISTAMEPELGFIMGNLALTGHDGVGQRVLVLYAAALGATNLVGVDSDSSVFESAKDEFKRHMGVLTDEKSGSVISRLAIPRFIHGDVLDPSSTECLCTANSFDSIVCDPPYNIGAPVLIGGEDARPINNHRDDSEEKEDDGPTSVQIDMIIPSILAIARNVLINGGRLVFFLPVRGEEMSMSLEQVLSKKGWQLSGTDDEQLQIQFGRLQHFSPTFARWLVCMTKYVQK